MGGNSEGLAEKSRCEHLEFFVTQESKRSRCEKVLPFGVLHLSCDDEL